MDTRYKLLAATVALVLPLTMASEGLRTRAYLDPVNIPTICYGETDGVRLGDTRTPQECRDMLVSRLAFFDRALTRCMPSLPDLPAPVHAAILDWGYNVGTGAACKSTLAKLVNRGDLKGACNQLPRWDKATTPDGKRVTLPGLTTRRLNERDLCLKGVPK